MKLKKLICFVFALILLLSAAACQKPSEQEKTGEFRASVDMLVEHMELDETAAIGVLEMLASLGLDERIEHIYKAEDEDGKAFYKVWFGLNLLIVYLDGNNVSNVYKYGVQIYPQTDDGDASNEDNSNDNNNNEDNKNEDAPKELKIEIVSLTSPVEAGKSATVDIIGEPETEYDITVRYSSGESSAKGLEPKHSDSDGRVSWTWKVSANVKPGEYSIEITSGDASYKTTFIVE